MGPVVTVSGPHGTGKSAAAKALAERFGLRYVSAGDMFRRIARERGITFEDLTQAALLDLEIDLAIDQTTRSEAEKGTVVLDGQLTGWMAREYAAIKIYLTAPDPVRIQRIASRDSISPEEAREKTVKREEAQKTRYKNAYGIDVDDISVYNLVVDTSILDAKALAEFLAKILEIWREKKPKLPLK